MKYLKRPRTRTPLFDDDPCKRATDSDLRACTWNVRSLNRGGASARLVDVLARVKADITAIQEMRGTGQGKKNISCTFIMYNIDSYHYLVGTKFRARLCVATNVHQTAHRMFNIAKLQSQQTATRYSTRLSLLLSEIITEQSGMHEHWINIYRALRTAAEEEIVFRRVRKNNWYDEEWHAAAEKKDAAYRATLRSGSTRDTWEERRNIRRKNRETEIRECKELEVLANSNHDRKLYQKVRRLTEGFKTGASSCKNKDGDLVTDARSVLKLWS